MAIVVERTTGELYIVNHRFEYIYSNSDEVIISNSGEPLIAGEKWSILKI